ncbi:MAG: histidine kinase [Firmicutes bacterium]|nr:histidine kinase [Bacillota bacterium]
MNDGLLSANALKKILSKTLGALEESRGEIYEVAESARRECDRTEKMLNEVRREMHQAILDVEELGRRFKETRVLLYQVSKNYDDYSEEQKRGVYEKANSLRERLALAREKEANLRLRRDNLEQTFVRLKEIVEKAEGLVSRVGVALNYLAGNIQDVNVQIENIEVRELVSQEILKGQEHERKRVASALHDGPVQDLVNLGLQMEICERLYTAGRFDEAWENFIGFKTVVKSSLKEMRRIIYDLNPMTLEDLGLVLTVKNSLQGISKATGIATHFNLLGKEVRLDSNVELALFRTIQEALNNSCKHGDPNSIVVCIEFLPHQINVEVEDDGRGFSMAAIQSKVKTGRHFGLLIMQNRIKILNGNLRILTEPGKGTKIVVNVPINYT